MNQINKELEEIIKIDTQKFVVKVIEYLDYYTKSPVTYGVRIGQFFNNESNKIEPCVSITVTCEHEDERMRVLFPANIAAITRIDYHPNCCLNELLTRGTGTVKMIKVSMAYVMKKFPWVKQFTLEDSSTILCGPEHLKMYTSLQTLSLCTHGKTWYERTFNAKIKDSNIHAIYRSKMDLIYCKINIPFEEFCKICNIPNYLVGVNAIVKESIIGLHNPNKQANINVFKTNDNKYDLHKLLGKYYNDKKTYLEFFLDLRKDTLNNNILPFCWIINSWAINFIDHLLQQQTFLRNTWIIDCENMNDVEITIQIQNGGSKYMEKPKKPRKTKSPLLSYRDYRPVYV